MRSKIPQEIDQLMWSVAEEGSANALSEFEQRYPEHKFELARRLTMVRELKGAKKGKSEVVVRAPRFQPRANTTSQLSVGLRAGLITMGVVALGTIAFIATTMTTPSNVPAPAPIIETGAPKGPEVVYLPPKQPQTKPVDQTPPSNPPAQPVQEADALLKPTDIVVEVAPLQTVLRMVAAAGLRKITILDGLGMIKNRSRIHQTGPSPRRGFSKDFAESPFFSFEPL